MKIDSNDIPNESIFIHHLNSRNARLSQDRYFVPEPDSSFARSNRHSSNSSTSFFPSLVRGLSQCSSNLEEFGARCVTNRRDTDVIGLSVNPNTRSSAVKLGQLKNFPRLAVFWQLFTPKAANFFLAVGL